MKQFLCCVGYWLLLQLPAFGQATLSGKITDAKDGSPLPGAIVYIADLRTGVTADLDGNYVLNNLPERNFLVQVKLIGYTTLSAQVNTATVKQKNFAMSAATVETGEVVVTGSAFTSLNNRSSVPVAPIDRKELQSTGAGNIVAALGQVPGVSGISTGSSIDKPVIRGLGYNRIVTVNEGLRQEGQQWGDEHGLEIDQFSADRIEILKGPSSLLYGSDALGGVINILEPLPAPEGCTHGAYDAQVASNNGLVSSSLMLEGNHKGSIWRVRGTLRDAGSFITPAERVYNSAFKEQDLNVLLGLNRKWGYSHLHFSMYDSKPGLVEGERDSASGKLTDAEGNIAVDNGAWDHSIALPFQRINHLKVSSVNSLFIGQGNLRITAGFQQNRRREYEDSSTEPGLYFSLNTSSIDAKYYLPEKKNWESVVGVSSLLQSNQNKGSEFLIPDYTMADAGAFVSVKKNLKAVSVNGGLRFDNRSIKGKQMIVDGDSLFAAFNSSFDAISGSAGLAWEVNEHMVVKANCGRGFRAPNIAELSANGVHEGTFRYEIGNTSLKPETSLQFDLGFGWKYHRFSGEVSVFHNAIDHFIYYRNLNNETIDVSGSSLPVYRYVQGNSTLKGFEFSADIHPVDLLHFENSLSYVWAQNNETDKPLPFIPPFHWKSEVKVALPVKKLKRLRDPEVRCSMEYYAAQDRVDPFETSTGSAVVWNAAVSTELRMGKDWATFFVQVSNLGDRLYYNHLSRLKDAGIAEQGRNVTVGCTIPFGLSHTK